METKTLHIKVILFLLLQCMLMFAVNSEDLTCEAGYGIPSRYIFTSGDSSQCSGPSKITTEAECQLAAEYNSKNNIDQNEGYGGEGSSAIIPPGCYCDRL